LTGHAHLLKQLDSEAHVWFTNPATVVDADQLARCMSLLSAEEKDRHRRFKFEKDRHQFLVAHAMVRTVLSSYADVHPSAWQFSYNPYGRPEISAPDINTPLRFNLTHTEGLVACLVTLNSDCGIDAENLRLPGNPQGIAEKMFATSERHALNQLQGQAFLERFLTYWTLREAYCKAIGLGLSSPMNHFAFECADGEHFSIRFDELPKEALNKLIPLMPFDCAQEGVRQGSLERSRRAHHERNQQPAVRPELVEGLVQRFPNQHPRHWQFTVLKPSPAHIAAIAICSDEPAKKVVVQPFHFP